MGSLINARLAALLGTPGPGAIVGLASSPCQREAVWQELVRKAGTGDEGVAYLHLLWGMAAGQLRDVHLGSLPPGLEALINAHLSRALAPLADREASAARRALAALAAAAEPLSESDVAAVVAVPDPPASPAPSHARSATVGIPASACAASDASGPGIFVRLRRSLADRLSDADAGPSTADKADADHALPSARFHAVPPPSEAADAFAALSPLFVRATAAGASLVVPTHDAVVRCLRAAWPGPDLTATAVLALLPPPPHQWGAPGPSPSPDQPSDVTWDPKSLPACNGHLEHTRTWPRLLLASAPEAWVPCAAAGGVGLSARVGAYGATYALHHAMALLAELDPLHVGDSEPGSGAPTPSYGVALGAAALGEGDPQSQWQLHAHLQLPSQTPAPAPGQAAPPPPGSPGGPAGRRRQRACGRVLEWLEAVATSLEAVQAAAEQRCLPRLARDMHRAQRWLQRHGRSGGAARAASGAAWLAGCASQLDGSVRATVRAALSADDDTWVYRAGERWAAALPGEGRALATPSRPSLACA